MERLDGTDRNEPAERPAKPARKPRRPLRRILTVFNGMLIVLLVLLLAGFVYQWFGERSDREAYVAPGQRVEVDGRMMHVYHEEKPGKAADEGTVVLISGWGTANPYADFSPVYPLLRDKASFAVVDRFGYGYSDVTDEKRKIDRMAEELHEGLKKAGVRPPYVLTAHSLGSLEAIRFAQRYPDEVKGIVMIDSGSPEFYLDFPVRTMQLQRVAIKSGLVRALYHVKGFDAYLNGQRNGLKLLSPEMKEQDRLATLLVAINDNVTNEIREAAANAGRVIEDKSRLDLPMTQLVADQFGAVTEEWLDDQRRFGESWSESSSVVLVQGSAHSIQAYHPEAVAEAALELAE
ncbi:alpha/beta fold hydrolase [Saccharibacillus alkalitolerans]|uniref:Alpha/beta hydrolase n=1 Tax=Saccharibacillus alkalitolerans TaxID=2705290 RepID=A0ABX0F6F7_9BACL|nr:alpha/beta hydrolase [Saccharibacillus alkalitolerans]NGZ76337.1 alpha/beta hydrolase [Saccharibacillus alkalitolerans]